MNTVASVLEEIQTWQQAPCEELRVGFLGKTGDATKRIMLYGVTQVGKTTLLMNMMGVLPQKREQLMRILRGGARTGNSATSTAVIYNKWDQEQFGLAVTTLDEDVPTTPELLSEEAFAGRITELNKKNRSAMAHDVAQYKDIFHYYIPSHYFEKEAEDAEAVQYIDLPGFGEKSKVMRERADALITKCASRVDGAIIVLKANNIVRIQQDYAEFISRMPNKRLILVVTHAVKECVEIKNLATQYPCVKEDEEQALWMEIAKKHRGLIDVSNTGLEEVSVFPVELDSYLEMEKRYSQLRGVFRHSRHFLREHIRKIPAKNTFSACEEMLALQIDLAEKKGQSLEKQLAQKKTQLQDAQEQCKKLQKEQNALTKKLSALDETIAEQSKLVQIFSDAIGQLKGTDLITGDYIKNSLVDMFFQNSTEKHSYLTEHMRYHLEQWLPPQPADRPYTQLRDRLMAIAIKAISILDTDDLLKKRDGWIFKAYGAYSRAYVDSCMSEEAEKLRRDMHKELKSWEKKKMGKAKEEKAKLAQKNAKVFLTVQELQAQIRQYQEEIAQLKGQIKDNQKQIKLLEVNKENVRSVFVKHFYLKKKELERRIAAEKDPNVKMALLLVLSTIYRNMKHHIEEQECQT